MMRREDEPVKRRASRNRVDMVTRGDRRIFI